MTKDLIGTTWRHRCKHGIYRVTQSRKDEVYLQAESKGCRSTWKWVGLLIHDYDQIPFTKSPAHEGTTKEKP